MTIASPDTPDRLTEKPPEDRFCDLVLNGGVASGVVYPWALLKLARHFRFRSIGGNSVGAMAAALAAAAEYGRCHGVTDAFEPLRRLPLGLAENDAQGRTKMLRLFQPTASVRRLFELFLILFGSEPATAGARAAGAADLTMALLRLYRLKLTLLVLALTLAALLLVAAWQGLAWPLLIAFGLLAGLGVLVVVAALLAWRLWRDLDALADNGYGLCTGRSQEAGEEGLVEWLHKGIQRSAGRTREEPPLTFADLWAAPRFGRRGPAPLPGGLQPPEPGIELQMFTSNVTQGRPVRLPLADANTRLYFDPEEWERYFPPAVLKPLVAASQPYAPASASDPVAAKMTDPQQKALLERLRELPGGDLPIVVAARMSLCFPVLFSTVKVYAVDYEAPREERRLRPCLLSDGGLCTNFPVHLFDAAHPQWPTFGMLLDARLEKFKDQVVWLPTGHLQGRGDNWQRQVPGAEFEGRGPRPLASRLLGFAGGLLLTMKDWNDRVTGRLPQVRNRIIRLALQPGEGQLNIAMPRETILRMASEYGTTSGQKLVDRFEPLAAGPSRGWCEHLYVRSIIELRALRRHLAGYAKSVQSGGQTRALRDLLADAECHAPLEADPKRPDLNARPLKPRQRAALLRAVDAVEALEAELAACERDFGPYEPVLEPELRLRPPI